MSNSLNLQLPYVQAAQAQKHVTVNEALRRLDAAVQLGVESRTLTAPPADPQEGERYIVAPAASGAWAGQDFAVAAWLDGAWVFFQPAPGWMAFVKAESAIVFFTGSAWEILVPAGTFQSTAKLGVNSGAGVVNRLVVRARASLFAPDPTLDPPNGSTRVKVSKDAATDIASHLFQTDYSTRAELGLVASDDFMLKVSPDGQSFAEAFRVDGASAVVDFAKVPAVGGVQGFAFSVPSRAALEATAVPADVDQVDTRGFAAENDGGGGRYERVASLPADGLGVEDAAGGFWSLAGDTVTARQAGAVGDGASDDTQALRRALQSGRDVLLDAGRFRVTDVLRSAAAHQRMVGAGRGRTRIMVGPDFNLGAPAVIRIANDFVTVTDIEVEFDQSEASSRATLIAYPPAIDLSGETRCRLARLRLSRCFEGVRATGNAGGAIFDDIECGALDLGFRLGGSFDTIELRNCRVWPYGFAGDPVLFGIYQDGETVGFRIARVDDLKMTNCTPFKARLVIEDTDGVGPFGTITGLALDGSYSRIEMSAGRLTISSLYATTEDANDTFIELTGGSLAVSDFSFRGNETVNAPFLLVNGAGATCQIQNGRCILGASIQADGFRVDQGQLTVSATRFDIDPTVDRTGACIVQTGGNLIAFGNHCNGPTTGSGTFIKVATDGNNAIFGNDSNGWAIELPSARANGIYGPNHDGSRVVMDSVMTLGATGSTSEGGEILLEGAGGAATAALDNFEGNVRVHTLDAGKSFQVLTDDGSARLSGEGLSFTHGLRLDRGGGDDVASTACGHLALPSASNGTANTAFGFKALRDVGNGDANTAVGAEAASAISGGSGNTMVGSRAGRTLPGGTGNTGVGRNAFAGQSSAVSNCVALGNGATVTGNIQVQLGNSSTTVYAYGSVQARSDARDKADIRDTELGLDFVRRLRPVDFRWDYREDYRRPDHIGPDEPWDPPAPGSCKRTRYHHGFLAQDVARLIDETGLDFGGYQDHAIAGGQDVKSLGYTELLAPLVKAIQELCARVEALEAPR